MNFRKMLECLALYAKSDRAPELREAVQRLVDDEAARRKRTAARLWEMREMMAEMGTEDRVYWRQRFRDAVLLAEIDIPYQKDNSK